GRERRRLWIELAQARAVRDRVFLPAAEAEHDVASGILRMARAHDLADGAAHHRLPDLGGLGVRLRPAHAAAHVGIEREKERAHEQLALARLGDRPLRQLEIVEAGRALGPAIEQNLAIDAHARTPSYA